MKFFKIAAMALSLTVSAGAFASAPTAKADCSVVKNNAKPVCKAYNVLRYAVKAYYKDLKSEERSLEATRDYWRTCKQLYTAIAEGEGKATIESRLQKVYKKDNAVVSQVSFLARFSDKYKTHKSNILWDKQVFEDTVNDFLSSSEDDDADDFDDDNEADDTDDSDDADDFDDA